MSDLQVNNLADVVKVISLEPLDPSDERYTDLPRRVAAPWRDHAAGRLHKPWSHSPVVRGPSA